MTKGRQVSGKTVTERGKKENKLTRKKINKKKQDEGKDKITNIR